MLQEPPKLEDGLTSSNYRSTINPTSPLQEPTEPILRGPETCGFQAKMPIALGSCKHSALHCKWSWTRSTPPTFTYRDILTYPTALHVDFFICLFKHVWTIYIWVNDNISLTWIKAIWGWFTLLTMIPVRENSEVVIIYPYIYIHIDIKYTLHLYTLDW